MNIKIGKNGRGEPRVHPPTLSHSKQQKIPIVFPRLLIIFPIPFNE
jgi:hypothetical protein